MMKTRTLRGRAALAGAVAATFAVALAVASTLAGDSADDKQATGTSCAQGVVSRLYLGQQSVAGAVTESQWRSFVTDVVTPAFPAGFTELLGHGRWRDDRGTLIEEQTRIVEIVHDGSRAQLGRVTAVANDYRLRFAQQSVLVTRAPALHCFESGD